MSPNGADGMANSVDPNQTAPLGAVWSGYALFAQAYLSENLGSLRYEQSYEGLCTFWHSVCIFWMHLILYHKKFYDKLREYLIVWNFAVSFQSLLDDRLWLFLVNLKERNHKNSL